MNASAVELESVHWLVQLTERHEDADLFFRQQFKARTTEIGRCIEARSGADKVWRRKALRAWNDGRRLAAIRNQVAHNPISFWWKDPAEQGEPDFVFVVSMKGAGRKPRDMLERQEADQAGNELAALAQRLAALREEWCARRDQGLVPSALQPKQRARRIRARIYRWVDKLAMSMEEIRESHDR